MTPDENGDDAGTAASGAAPDGLPRGADPTPEANGSRPAPAASEAAPPDPVRAMRERVERALGPAGGGARAAPAPPHPRLAGRGAESWGRESRRRVSAPPAGAGEPGAPAASGDPDPRRVEIGAAAPADPEPETVRERVERRLREAEDRREASRDTPFAPTLTPAPSAAASEERRPEGGPGRDRPLSMGGEGRGSARGAAGNDWEPPWAGEAEDPPPAPAAGALPGRSRLAEGIATCGFLGRIPWAPGTFGAAAGFGAFFLTRQLSAPEQIGLLLAVIAAGTWAAGRYAKERGQRDPQPVVVDEFAGMWLALAVSNPSLPLALGAFAAFRALDILKPPPVRQAEGLPGGFGIMADDLLAGGLVRAGLFVFFGQ